MAGTSTIYLRIDSALAESLKTAAFSQRRSLNALCSELLARGNVIELAKPPPTPTVRIEGNRVYRDDMPDEVFRHASYLFSMGKIKNGDPVPKLHPSSPTPTKKGGKRAKAP